MKKETLRNQLLLFVILISSSFALSSCGGEDDGPIIDSGSNPDPIVKNGPFDKIAAIAVKDDQIYQMDVNLESETVQETNLTKSSGVEIPYQIFTSDTHVSFLYRQGQKYSFKTKRFENMNVEGHDMICGYESSDLEAAKSSTVVDDYLLIITGSGDSYDELSVRSKHIPTGNCQKISFGQGYDFDFNHILYEDNHLVVSFTNLSGQYSISYIDLVSGEASTTTFDKYYSATLSEGMVHMLFNDGTGAAYEVYDPKDWSLIETKEFASYLNFGSNGLVQTQMYQNKALIDFQYAQPAPQGNGPEILNLNTGEFDSNSQVLSKLKLDLEKKYEASIKISSYKADLESETLVVAFEVIDFDGNKTGGLVLSNFNGAMTKDLALPYAPYSFEFVD